MSWRPKTLSGALVASALLLTSCGLSGFAESTTDAHLAHAAPAMAMATASSPEDPDGDG